MLMASSSTAPAAVTIGAPPATKLTRENFLYWQAQVLPSLRGARVMGLLEGSDSAPPETLEEDDENQKKITIPNPAYDTWIMRDQQVVSYLVNSLSEDVLPQVFGLTHAADVWTALHELYSSQSKSRVSTIHGALTNTKKLDLSAQQYITKMKGFASELAAAGKPVDDDGLKDYILNGLDGSYNGLVAAINAHPNTKLNDACSQLLSYETRDNMLASTDMASPINFNQFLEKEKLKSNGSNFTDWFRHVRIFLNGGNLQYVLDAPLGDPPAETETDEVKNVYATRKTRCMMEEGSSVSEHMLAMTGHAKKLSDLGIVIPNRLGINRVLQSLPPSYKNFVMNYNMQNMNKELPELFSMLKSAEIEIKKEHQVLMVNKTTSFKKQGKSKGKFKKGGKKAATPPVKPKTSPKPDAECYYCKEKGHWKRNCSKYLADLKSGLVKKKKEGISDIHVIDVYLTGSRTSTWVFDTGSVAHICNSKQELKNKRRLLKDEVTMRV
ncbi:hypothetical protein QYE76_025321 [Lolium multiflorum]|uniref:CCHC-type domain-containing protein n=1 Tax=Lolium multiflorum TaxID=4521 RepID=A0AAD8VUJ6_LOLMU|nr:hypothetical protein QYE76_025321 [Lolium multiflorum]